MGHPHTPGICIVITEDPSRLYKVAIDNVQNN